MSNGLPMNSSMNAPTDSSKKGTVQPPSEKPPVSSSSGPPGAWAIPSRDTNVLTTSLLTVLLRSLLGPPTDGPVMGWTNEPTRTHR